MKDTRTANSETAKADSPSPEPGRAKKPAPPLDPALSLARKLDSLMQAMPAWARSWALNYLWAKYSNPSAEAPATVQEAAK